MPAPSCPILGLALFFIFVFRGAKLQNDKGFAIRLAARSGAISAALELSRSSSRPDSETRLVIPRDHGCMAKTFKAILEPDGTPLNWVIVRIPFDVAEVWGTRGRMRVRGEINGFPFHTSLFPACEGKHYLLVNKQMQKGAGAGVGTMARFRLEPDAEERMIDVPEELQRAMSEDRSLRRWFDRLTYSMRKYLTNQVTAAKTAGARKRRAGRIAEQLLSAKEAERDPPPILESALARDARAREGWKRMSAGRRRMNLLAIFYYKGPEARARRVAKVVKEAHGLAERQKKK